MKKVVSIFALMAALAITLPVRAAESIHKIISNSKIPKGAISVSVKDINTGKAVFELNEDRPVNPASTQKLVTTAAALNTLGKDYKFETKLYKSTNNDIYIKLGADPYLTTGDLKTLFGAAKAKNILEPKTVYIDDYILDSVNWGEGWQWDDELNPLMPKFGSYNLDKNLINIVIAPTAAGAPANVYPEVFYPYSFINLVTTGAQNDIKISHNTSIASGMLQVDGTVKTLTKETIPVNNMKRYFRLRVEDAITDSKVLYYGKVYEKKLPDKNVYLVKTIDHKLEDALKDILQNSNNMIAETVFKIAGGKFVNNTGSEESALKMLNDYCSKLGLKAEDIKIVDGSGVSKNNLMTTDFMTNFLVAETKDSNFDMYKSSMATPGIGTLNNRMLYFKENLNAKTGTLTDVSAIAGYIKTQRGNEYAFDIMINDPKSKSSDKKMLEEYILRSVFANY